MPQYSITDPTTGRTVKATLPRAPQTESEILYIFSHQQNLGPANMRPSPPPMAPLPSHGPGPEMPQVPQPPQMQMPEPPMMPAHQTPPQAPMSAGPPSLNQQSSGLGLLQELAAQPVAGMDEQAQVPPMMSPPQQQPMPSPEPMPSHQMGGPVIRPTTQADRNADMRLYGGTIGPSSGRETPLPIETPQTKIMGLLEMAADPGNWEIPGAAAVLPAVSKLAVRGATKFAKTLTTKASPKAILSMMKHSEFDLPAMVTWLKELPTAAKVGREEILGFMDSLTKPAAKMTPLNSDTPRWARMVVPEFDKYAKRTGFVTKKLILKKLAETKDVPEDVRAHFTALADVIGGTPVDPRHFQAMAAGETYVPERAIRKIAVLKEGEKKRSGAPPGVTTSKQERALRDRYVQWMGEGAGGRMWYHDSGKAIKFLANDDPKRASMLAEDLSATSPTTTVGANTGFGVKGFNQATAGVPVQTGRFPRNMSPVIEKIHGEGGTATGLKRTPFADNLSHGGEFYGKDPATLRAVHDIWDGEAHGFVNPDGSPIRAGFTEAQHRWMDEQAADAVRIANDKRVGGVNDWTELEAQAATWTAAKIRAGDVKPGDEAKSYADFFKKLYAQGSRETVPGATTGHLQEIQRAPYEVQALLHDIVTKESGIYDAKGRDQIMAGYGGLTGGSFDAPGVFEGGVRPGKQALSPVGSEEIKGGEATGSRRLDAGSRRLMEASEALYALLTGQDAAAGSKLLAVGKGLPANAVDIALPGGPIGVDAVIALMDRLRARGLDQQVILVPTPDGVRIGNAGMEMPVFGDVVKSIGGKVTDRGSAFDENTGLYIGNEWNKPGQEVGQRYYDPALGGPEQPFAERFDKFAPAMAQKMREVDDEFVRLTGGKFTLSPYIDEVRATIANEGAAGLNRLAKKYGISAVLLGAALQHLGLQPPDASAPAPDATASLPPEG